MKIFEIILGIEFWIIVVQGACSIHIFQSELHEHVRVVQQIE